MTYLPKGKRDLVYRKEFKDKPDLCLWDAIHDGVDKDRVATAKQMLDERKQKKHDRQFVVMVFLTVIATIAAVIAAIK